MSSILLRSIQAASDLFPVSTAYEKDDRKSSLSSSVFSVNTTLSTNTTASTSPDPTCLPLQRSDTTPLLIGNHSPQSFENATEKKTSNTTTSSSSSRRNTLLRAPSLPRSREKTRSMTAAELAIETISATELTQLAERLRSEEPPLSLEEAKQRYVSELDAVRQRSASVKEERKASIEFIRSRTSSRAAGMGRPVGLGLLLGGGEEVEVRTQDAETEEEVLGENQ